MVRGSRAWLVPLAVLAAVPAEGFLPSFDGTLLGDVAGDGETVRRRRAGLELCAPGEHAYEVPVSRSSAETTATTAFDRLSVEIRSTAGATLATLATFSNLNAGGSYVQRSFDLAAFKGQTVRVHLRGVEDTTLQTSSLVDDAAVTVTR